MEPARLWNRRFVQLLAIEALLQMGGFITRPIIANYAMDLGASTPLAGFLAGMLATAALVMRPVSGAVSDRLSKKTLLVIASSIWLRIGSLSSLRGRLPGIARIRFCI